MEAQILNWIELRSREGATINDSELSQVIFGKEGMINLKRMKELAAVAITNLWEQSHLRITSDEKGYFFHLPSDNGDSEAGNEDETTKLPLVLKGLLKISERFLEKSSDQGFSELDIIILLNAISGRAHIFKENNIPCLDEKVIEILNNSYQHFSGRLKKGHMSENRINALINTFKDEKLEGFKKAARNKTSIDKFISYIKETLTNGQSGEAAVYYLTALFTLSAQDHLKDFLSLTFEERIKLIKEALVKEPKPKSSSSQTTSEIDLTQTNDAKAEVPASIMSEVKTDEYIIPIAPVVISEITESLEKKSPREIWLEELGGKEALTADIEQALRYVTRRFGKAIIERSELVSSVLVYQEGGENSNGVKDSGRQKFNHLNKVFEKKYLKITEESKKGVKFSWLEVVLFEIIYQRFPNLEKNGVSPQKRNLMRELIKERSSLLQTLGEISVK